MIANEFVLQGDSIYRQNRAKFYSEAAGRIREAVLSGFIAELRAVSSPGLEDTTGYPLDMSDELEVLLLRDALKKPNFGTRAGRTVISVGSFLSAAIQIEEDGILFYSAIGRVANEQSAICFDIEQVHRANLARLTRIEDSLRYHRLKLT